MSRSTTPTYRVETFTPGVYSTPTGWPTKHCGRPSDATLARYVADFEESCQPGGCNAHLGYRPVRSARIFRQSTGEIVATYNES